MNHFSARDWADFACEVESPERVEMERHLRSGCQSCVDASSFWRTIRDVGARESGNEPPEGSVRLAKDLFWVNRLAGEAKASRARLVFDSFRQPVLAGVRSLASTPRQLFFEQGPFRIDTRLEVGSTLGRTSLVGQVVKESAEQDGSPSQGLAHVSVLLLAGERVVNLAHTNLFGEFHLEFQDAPDLRLWVAISSRRPILMVLPGPEAPGDPADTQI